MAGLEANDSATSSNTNETPEFIFNNIISETPLSGVSFSSFSGMTESGLHFLLGLPQYATIDAGTISALLALKAQLNQQLPAAPEQGFYNGTSGCSLSEQQQNNMWKYCVLVEFVKKSRKGEKSFCSGVIFDVDKENIYLLLNWHSVNKLKGNHTMKISQEVGDSLLVLKELDIVASGDVFHVASNVKDDWVMFKIELAIDLEPPPLHMNVSPTLKIHLFGFPSIGDLTLGASNRSDENIHLRGMVIPAEVTQIQQGHFFISTLSQQGLSGAAVVCDQNGGIAGICCGQWENFQGFAVNIHHLPTQKRFSPPSSPDSGTTSAKKAKVK